MENTILTNTQARTLFRNYSKFVDKYDSNEYKNSFYTSIKGNKITTEFTTTHLSVRRSTELTTNSNEELEFLAESKEVEKAFSIFDKKNDITISRNDKGVLTLSNNKDTFKTPSDSVTLYLESPFNDTNKVTNTEKYSKTIKELELLLHQHFITVSKDETKDRINKIWFEKDYIVSLDSFQMLVTENSGMVLNAGLPLHLVKVLLSELKSVKDKDVQISIGVKTFENGEKYWYFSFTENRVLIELTTKVLVDSYIGWESIYDNHRSLLSDAEGGTIYGTDFNIKDGKGYSKINIDAKKWKTALKKISKFTNRDNPTTKISITKDNIELEKSTDKSRYSTTVQIENKDRKEMEIGLGYYFLENYLNIEKNIKEINLYIAHKEVVLYFRKDNKVYIIMPMDLN